MNNRLPLIESILAKHCAADEDSLMGILREIQQVMGYLSQDALAALSQSISIDADAIYEAAVACGEFSFSPHGKHHIKVCCGTACRLKGSQKILDKISDCLDIDPGEMTADGKFSLEVIACQDACCTAPLISIGGDVYLKTTESDIDDILYGLD